MSKTIDNLGVEISTRFAKDLEQTQIQLISESKVVTPKAQIDVTSPAFKSAYDSMFGLRQRNKEWAIFQKSNAFDRTSSRIFVHHLLPSIRSDEFGLMESDRIKARLQSKKKKRLQEKPQREYDWEERYEDEEELKESEILLFFIQAVQNLDKSLLAINASRSQYQKG